MRPRGRIGDGWVIGGVALIVAGALAGATVAGWAASNRLVTGNTVRADREIVTVALPDYIPGTSSRMPDVRGLRQDDAEAVLAEAGVPASAVDVEIVPAAGPAGVVTSQSPVFGTVNPSIVRLTVSELAFMPDVLGLDPASAVGRLQELGARVAQLREYVPGAVVGTVIETDPVAAVELPELVTVVIADTPMSVDFDHFTRVEGSAANRTTLLHGGVTWDDYLRLTSRAQPVNYAWRFGGLASIVQGSFAIREGATGAVLVSLYGDGALLGQLQLTDATPQPISIDVRGVQTFTIQTTRTSAGSSFSSVDVDFLGAEVLGSYTKLGGTP